MKTLFCLAGLLACLGMAQAAPGDGNPGGRKDYLLIEVKGGCQSCTISNGVATITCGTDQTKTCLTVEDGKTTTSCPCSYTQGSFFDHFLFDGVYGELQASGNLTYVFRGVKPILKVQR